MGNNSFDIGQKNDLKNIIFCWTVPTVLILFSKLVHLFEIGVLFCSTGANSSLNTPLQPHACLRPTRSLPHEVHL